MEFKHAKPIDNRLLIGIAGPQGSGKTTSALRIATGIVQHSGGKIGFIDTENKRALRYASSFDFNHLELDPPFSPMRYDEAVKYAQNNGYGVGDVLVIDSMSHEHEGVGGVLDMHEEYMKSKNYNPKFNMLGWNHAKKGRKKFISSTLQRSPCHIILCFRAKKGLKEQKVNGKTAYVDQGLEAIGADEYFYEMDISLILPMGSEGKPDWSEKASRVNEYGATRPLTEMLHNTSQLSEQTGLGIATLSSVAPEVAKTPEELLQEKAKGVVREIKASSDEESLKLVMEDRELDLDEIQGCSQTAYDYIMKEYNNKRAELGIDPTPENNS